MKKFNLPDRLVVISNHQCYTDWMYLWIMACYAGHASGIVILLKYSIRKIPILGWGMVGHTKSTLTPATLLQIHLHEALLGSR